MEFCEILKFRFRPTHLQIDIPPNHRTNGPAYKDYCMIRPVPDPEVTCHRCGRAGADWIEPIDGALLDVHAACFRAHMAGPARERDGDSYRVFNIFEEW